MSIKLTPTVSVPAPGQGASARLDILEATTRAGSGHPSSSWSAVEIVATLFFGGVLRYRPKSPDWLARPFHHEQRPRRALLYAVLAHAGYFDREMLSHPRRSIARAGSPIQGLMPGVEATNRRWARVVGQPGPHCGGRLNIDTAFTSSWVTANARPGRSGKQPWLPPTSRADRLTAILDYNKYQETGPISRGWPWSR